MSKTIQIKVPAATDAPSAPGTGGNNSGGGQKPPSEIEP